MRVRLECPICGESGGAVVHLREDPIEYDEGYIMSPGGLRADRTELACGCRLRDVDPHVIYALEDLAERILLDRYAD